MIDLARLDVSTGLLLAFVGIAAVTDVRKRKIYNWTTYSGLLAALLLNAAGSLVQWSGAESESLRRVFGWIGLGGSCLGLLACGSLLIVCFVFFRIGGGDVKLMAMLGAFMGPFAGIEAVLWSFVLGAALGVILLVWRVGAVRMFFGGLKRLAAAVRLRDFSLLVAAGGDPAPAALFLAPSALAGVVLVRFHLVAHL